MDFWKFETLKESGIFVILLAIFKIIVKDIYNQDWHSRLENSTKPNRTPLDDRLCLICGVLEDEFHFMLECSLYNDERKKYIKRYYWQRPNMPKFIQYMSSEKAFVIKNIAIFIEKAFKIREQVGII